MTKFKKIMLGSLATVSGVVAVTATSCGGPKYTEEELQAQKIVDNVYLVTDGGSVSDKSFNEQGKNALEYILTGTGLNTLNNINSPLKVDAEDIAKGYITADNKENVEFVIAPGFNHITAMGKFFKNHKDTNLKFILVDGVHNPMDFSAKPPVAVWDAQHEKNVAGITFNTNESAFFVGVYAAKYLVEIMKDDTPMVSAWGGGNFPGVTDFITGFINGVKYYNETLLPEFKKTTPSAKAVKFALSSNRTEQFNSGFEPKGKGEGIAKALIGAGADIIMPVAGSQTKNLLDEIAKSSDEVKGRVKVIGVDTDQKLAFGDKSQYFLTSVEKNLKDAIIKVYTKLLKEANKDNPDFKLTKALESVTIEESIKGLGETTVGTLENGLVSFSTPSKKLAGGKYEEAQKLYEQIKNDATIRAKALDKDNPAGAWTDATKDDWQAKIDDLNAKAGW
ncbi:Purine nucleoside receptor A [Mycoplasmopsis californica]|uniref:BMP family ABC transporter substrate-binding protein n=1 Tax=Mycoplasmopsis equigenitalium TaxID=114883 RepID=A0ABY5J6H2_9BACT|nr:BMP family ABC transporter substrate-binding protein [Mycoplasmopsis equigenitalium]UUD37283.1 BMP family ABC transporter substrate-binding protein [Mycoplasmopsis equigenitalium]VEU69408.1 Purine nucleoside receptor A [Mycoplasmopsis californica]